jgi:hypothetical protein
MKTVPLGTEYSVPNGTEKLGFVISFTDILSLTGHYFLNAFALVKFLSFFGRTITGRDFLRVMNLSHFNQHNFIT